MKSSIFVLIWLIGCGLVIIQVTWLRPAAWLNIAVQLPLLLVLITTIRTDWRSGVLLAVLLGLMYQIFSPLPGWIYPVGFMVAAAGAWILQRRLVTNRTSTSLIVSVLGGTAIYYATVATLIFVTRIFNGAALTPVWSIWLTAVVWQLLVHPLLAGGWWIITRQRQTALHLGSW